MVGSNHRSSENVVQDSLHDALGSATNLRLPLTLAWRELRNRYRRSIFGPLWITIALGFRIGALALVFTAFFDAPVKSYLIWLTAGTVAWEFIAGCLQSSGEWFSGRAGYLIQGQTSIGSLVVWGMASQLFIFLHSLPLCLAVGLLAKVEATVNLLFLPVGIFMVVSLLIPIGVILGVIVPRFRDIGPLIFSSLQIGYFLTPIMWIPKPDGITHKVALWNPFSYLVNWIRKPIIGESMSGIDFITWGGFILILAPLSFLIFVRFRRRLVYWL